MFRRILAILLTPLLLATLTGTALTWWLWPRPIAIVELPVGDRTEITLNASLRQESMDRFRQYHPRFCLLRTRGNWMNPYTQHEWCIVDLEEAKIRSVFSTESDIDHDIWTPDGKMLYFTFQRDGGDSLGIDGSQLVKSWIYDPTTNQHRVQGQRKIEKWNRDLIATDHTVMLDVTHPLGEPMRCEVIDPQTLQTRRTMVLPSHIRLEDEHDGPAPSCALSQDGKTFALAERWNGGRRTSPPGIELFNIETGTLSGRLTEHPADFQQQTDFSRYSREVGAFDLHFADNRFLLANIFQLQKGHLAWIRSIEESIPKIQGYNLDTKKYQRHPRLQITNDDRLFSTNTSFRHVSIPHEIRVVWATVGGRLIPFVTSSDGSSIRPMFELDDLSEPSRFTLNVAIPENAHGVAYTYRVEDPVTLTTTRPKWATYLPKSWQDWAYPPPVHEASVAVWRDDVADEMWEFRRVNGSCNVYARGDRLLLGIHQDGKSTLEIWASPPPRPVNPWLVCAVSGVVGLLSGVWIWRRGASRHQRAVVGSPPSPSEPLRCVD
ncbi:MAG: hypothetical protein ACRC8S_17565 [Fimbriiglobus sp.]